ncbi:MAG: hypothetical protein NVSMB67_19620 [Flavisolibacter sp.]
MRVKAAVGLLVVLLSVAPLLLRAQGGLNVSTGVNFFIKSGTVVSIDSLVLKPSADFNLSGINSINRSTTVNNSLSTPYLKRVYHISPTTAAFSGDISIYFQDAELNGIQKRDLTLDIYSGTAWQSYSSNVSLDGTSNFLTTTGIASTLLSEVTLVGATAAPVIASVSLSGATTFCTLDKNTYPLSATPTGGVWSGGGVVSSGGAYFFSPSTAASGSSVLSYSLTNSVGTTTSTVSATVLAPPAAFSVTGGGVICAGDPGLSIGLSNSEKGVTYSLLLNGASVTTLAGTGGLLIFAAQNRAGSYTISATRDAVSCASVMSGSALISVSNCTKGLYLTSTTDNFFIKSGTAVAIDSLVLTPSADLNISGVNSITRTTTVVHPILDPYIQRVYHFSPTLTSFSGDISIYFSNLELNGLASDNLLPDLYNGTSWNKLTSGISRDASINKISASAQSGISLNELTLVKGIPPPVINSVSLSPTSFCASDQTAYALSADPSGGVWTTTSTPSGIVKNTDGSYSFNPSLGSLGDNLLTYTLTNAGGSASKTLTAHVNSQPTKFVVMGGGAYCAGGMSSPVQLNNSQTGVNYTLLLNGSIVIGTRLGTGTMLDFGPQTAAGIYTITGVNTTTGCSSQMTGMSTVSINPVPSVNALTNAIYCSGSAAAAINFSSPVTATSFVWISSVDIGFGLTGSGNIPAFTAKNATVSPIAAIITVTPSTSRCTGPVYSFTITVNPLPTAGKILDQVVCNNSSTAQLNFSGTATSFTWTSDNASIGLGASGSGSSIASFMATNSGTVPALAHITVTPHYASGGVACDGAPVSFTLTVNPSPSLTSTLAPADICNRSVFSYTPTSSVPGTIFTWTRTSVVGISNTAASGSGLVSETLINTTNDPVTVSYIYSLSASGCPSLSSFTILAKVNPSPKIVTHNILVSLDGSGSATITPDQINNGSVSYCGGLWLSLDKTSFSCSDIGAPVTVVLTGKDDNGNTSSAAASVTVIDMLPPVISNVPANIIVYTGPGRTSCDQVASWTPPTAVDNCGAVTVTSTYKPGDLFTVGSPTTVSYSFTDSHGNTSSCGFTVSVLDNTAPVIATPLIIPTVNNDPGKCGAVVTVPALTATDNCGPVSYAYTLSGATAGSGTGSNATGYYNVGTTTIYWTVTDSHGNTSTASQTVTVTDNEKPLLSYPSTEVICFAASIPALTATDNCAIATVSYAITGATVRSGTGLDASGVLNPGVSTITWTVTDIHGNSATISSVLTQDKELKVFIPTAYAFAKGVKPNTVYLGYTPASSIALVAIPYGGAGYSLSGSLLTGISIGYKFLWSTGSTYPAIYVSPTATTTYSVTITDNLGCSVTAYRTITVQDIRCGLLNDMVTICRGDDDYPTGVMQTYCVSPLEIDEELGEGGYLGACTNATPPLTGIMPRAGLTPENRKLSMKATPNPSGSEFHLDIRSSGITTRAHLIIYNGMGRIVEEKEVTPNTSVHLGSSYINGLYYAELIQGNKKVTLKLLKITQ